MMRLATQDAVVEGHRFGAGRRVILLTYNLLKDRRYSPDPFRFDIHRVQHPESRQLWFGAGAHFCLGFGLAQREILAVLTALLAVPGVLRVRRRRYARGVLIPSYSRLEVEVGA
jgi:cytochrome P450